MEKRGISQETLKLIACVTMLIDHVGATLVWNYYLHNPTLELYCFYNVLRLIGRIAFPIYCFLLAEGAHYTRNPKKYALRLAVGAALAEIPFDIAFFDGITLAHSSVMVTLLLGFGMIEAMKRVKGFWKIVIILPFYLAAELLGTDYGGLGIEVIALFALTRGMKYEKLLQLVGLALLLIPGPKWNIGFMYANLEAFAVLAVIPIFCYSGKKLSSSKAVQWAFYLFYPVHIAILVLLEVLIFG